MEKIKKLTPQQEILLQQYKKDWFAIGSCTDPADKPRAEKAITEMYRRIDQAAPIFVWAPSPKSAITAIAKANHCSEKEVVNLDRFWGSMEAHWVAFYKFAGNLVEYKKTDSEVLELWSEICKSAGWWWPYGKVVFISDRPELIRWETDSGDQPPRLHSLDGPSVRFRDGWEMYCIRGVTVAKDVIMDPTWLTVERINAEGNAEIRRVYLEKFGQARYIRESEIKKFQEDTCGQLFRKELTGDEPLVMLRLLDSTPDRNGKREIYWFRVPPDMKTARQAVAWQWGVEEGEWNPLAES